MAKTGKTGGLGFGAYLALVLNAVAWLLKVIFEQFNIDWSIKGYKIPTLLTDISSLVLTIVALIVAHDYASRQTKFWRILYWVLAILSICAILFGVGKNFVTFK